MKKLLYSLLIVACASLASCSKDEPGGTATQKVAGQWYVTLEALDADGNVVLTTEDFLGVPRFMSITFNTADNVPGKMYVSDMGNFWDYQVEVDVDQDKMTFSTGGEFRPNVAYDCGVKITDGKITLGGATTPSGQKADAIVYYVSFDDDPYPAAYGFEHYRISGYRYTGFVADEE